MRVLFILLVLSISVQAQIPKSATRSIKALGNYLNSKIDSITSLNAIDGVIPLRNKSIVYGREMGIKGDGSDEYMALQNAITFCIKSNTRVLYLPVGNYKTSKPLIIKSQSSNPFVTLTITGESSYWDANQGTTLTYTGTNGAAIIIQRGKGCQVSNLKIIGRFSAPSFSNSVAFYNSTFEQFSDGVCDTSRFHPHAGIAIDYYTNPDGSISGSTATVIDNCEITGFYVGIISSPNGQTLNAENTIIYKVNFGNVNTCVASCQAQEKNNSINSCSCWGPAYQFFSTGQFGAREGANYWIEKINIAGWNVRFATIDEQGWFSLDIRNVYAESIGKVGTINGFYIDISFTNCHFDFAYPTEAGEQTILETTVCTIGLPACNYAKATIFRDCVFRYFGDETKIKIKGNAVYDHCYFSGGLPIIKEGVPTFTNSY